MTDQSTERGLNQAEAIAAWMSLLRCIEAGGGAVGGSHITRFGDRGFSFVMHISESQSRELIERNPECMVIAKKSGL